MPGFALLSDDFPDRLEQIKEASGLSWRVLARELGTDLGTVRRWRAGQRPSVTYTFAIFSVVQAVPDGLALVLRAELQDADRPAAKKTGER